MVQFAMTLFEEDKMETKKTAPKTGRNERGSTLLEVIIAVSILTVGILAVASMQLSAIIGNESAIELTEALTVAQDKLEDLIRVPIGDPELVDTNDDGTAGLNFPTQGQVGAGGDTLLPAGGANQPDFRSTVNVDGKNYYLYWNAAPGASGSVNIGIVVAWYERGRTHRADIHYIKFQ